MTSEYLKDNLIAKLPHDTDVSLNRKLFIEKISIKDIIIPHSYYNVDINNQNFNLNNPVGGDDDLALTSGYYETFLELGNHLEVILNTNTLGFTFTVDWSDITYKYTITETGANNFEITWTDEILGNTLGFSDDLSGDSEYTSDYIANLIYTKWIYIKSPIFDDIIENKHMNISATTGLSEIDFHISVYVNDKAVFGEYSTYKLEEEDYVNDVLDVARRKKNKIIDVINFKYYDEYGYEMRFNGISPFIRFEHIC